MLAANRTSSAGLPPASGGAILTMAGGVGGAAAADGTLWAAVVAAFANTTPTTSGAIACRQSAERRLRGCVKGRHARLALIISVLREKFTVAGFSRCVDPRLQ